MLTERIYGKTRCSRAHPATNMQSRASGAHPASTELSEAKSDTDRLPKRLKLNAMPLPSDGASLGDGQHLARLDNVVLEPSACDKALVKML